MNTVEGTIVALTGKIAWRKGKAEGDKGSLHVMIRNIEVEELQPAAAGGGRDDAETPAHGDADLPF